MEAGGVVDMPTLEHAGLSRMGRKCGGWVCLGQITALHRVGRRREGAIPGFGT